MPCVLQLQHVNIHYNTACSVQHACTNAVLAANVALPKRQGNREPKTRSGQLLSAVSAVEAAAVTAGQRQQIPSPLLAAVENLQPFMETTVTGLLEKAFQLQWGSEERLGEPRDPTL